jgi:hypothetical protein
MQLMQNATRELQVCSIAGNLPEYTPAAYLGAFHACLGPGIQTPLFNQMTQQGYQSNELELRISKIYLSYAGSGAGRKILEHPPKFP